MNRLTPLALACLPLFLVPSAGPAFSQETVAQEQIAQALPVLPDWSFEGSDLPVDPAFRFGRLENGMRFVIRPNATPAGTAMVHMFVDVGSLSETDDERGFAHFVEHMAFNGSTNVPEGEMIRLLEREGLAFGADTNASTDFDATIYKLDLPRNDPALLDTALFLMRETASELSFDNAAVDREKGVVLSERRVRDTYSFRNAIDGWQFLYPGARFLHRIPIGTVETLQAATGATLRAFWARNYVPANVTLIVAGDFDADLVEAKIRERFATWQGAPAYPMPDPGPVDFEQQGQTDIYLDPALAEQVTIARNGPYLAVPDTIENRQQDVLRQIGYDIVNRRLQRLQRQEDPPFRSAGVGNSDVFESGRTTNIVINAGDGEWRKGLDAAVLVYRQALEFGFSDAEIKEQVANLRSSLEDLAAGADTLSNGTYVSAAVSLIKDGRVPTTPESSLERFKAMQALITPENVLAALSAEVLPLDNPLIRFEGRTAPEGGEEALRSAWNEAAARPLVSRETSSLSDFGYTSFGTPGTVVADTVEPLLGIRTIRFANGVMLNLKPTTLQQDRVSVRLDFAGGLLLNTKENPLGTAMSSTLPVGGLGKHSYDDLQSILAGRTVGLSLNAGDDSFTLAANTTTRDLELQLQLMAAFLSDPGFRPQGEVQYKRNVSNFFARRDATPNSALGNALGEILSDQDPRFTLQPQSSYLALSFDKLRKDIGDRMKHGAIELAIVGDYDAQAAIDMVARTLGALPLREGSFQTYDENRQRQFTSDRTTRTVYHDGAPDQALIRLSWPTTDDSDPIENVRLGMLEQVTQILLTDKLREELGQTYSPSANASQSRIYPGWGLFSVVAAIDVKDMDVTRAAILEVVAGLRARPVDDDVLLRARRPVLERYDNALKTNNGWMALADRAQTESERLDRFVRAPERIKSVTTEDLHQTALRYLAPEQALEIDVIPRPKG